MRTRVLLLAVLLPAVALAQQPAPKTCKDTPAQCDKELLMLRDEVDQKRRAMAGIWAIAEEWQARAEQAEAQLKALEPVPVPEPKKDD